MAAACGKKGGKREIESSMMQGARHTEGRDVSKPECVAVSFSPAPLAVVDGLWGCMRMVGSDWIRKEGQHECRGRPNEFASRVLWDRSRLQRQARSIRMGFPAMRSR